MRRTSKLTQPEFGKHHGRRLWAIETDKGNRIVETFDQVADVVDLQVGESPRI